MNTRPLPETSCLPSPTDLFGDLPVQQVRFQVVLPPDAALPPFAGSAWRGLIGWELQRLVCPFGKKRPTCRDCLMNGHCPYALLFEEENTLPGLSDAPRGYLVFPEKGPEEENYALSITLFGACTKFLPLVLMAVHNGQNVGLGLSANRALYQVDQLREVLPNGIETDISLVPEQQYATRGPFPLREWIGTQRMLPGQLQVRLATPVRLRKKGRYLDRMDWSFFFASLIRRLEALNCLFHEGQPLGKKRWMDLKNGFQFNGNLNERLTWRDMARYSSRQRRMVPLGGIVGDVVFEKPSNSLVEWMRAAELVHVGKAVVMGLGKVKIL